MPNFKAYVDRHGEHGAQALVEMLERLEGVRRREVMALEDRWQALVANSLVAANSNHGDGICA